MEQIDELILENDGNRPRVDFSHTQPEFALTAAQDADDIGTAIQDWENEGGALADGVPQ